MNEGTFTTAGPYTTITVDQYARLKAVVQAAKNHADAFPDRYTDSSSGLALIDALTAFGEDE